MTVREDGSPWWRGPLVWRGGLALVFAVAHAISHVRLGHSVDLLWACNVAPFLIGIGCLLERRWLVAMGFLWLSYGTPMWLLDLAAGGEVMVTSFATHLGGLWLAGGALRRLGMPARAWLGATVAIVGLMLFCRWSTPPGPNVNLAHAVWAGWEEVFPRYDVYFVVVLAGCALTFAVTEWLFRRAAVRWPLPTADAAPR